jgi:hypothetical protein
MGIWRRFWPPCEAVCKFPSHLVHTLIFIADVVHCHRSVARKCTFTMSKRPAESDQARDPKRSCINGPEVLWLLDRPPLSPEPKNCLWGLGKMRKRKVAAGARDGHEQAGVVRCEALVRKVWPMEPTRTSRSARKKTRTSRSDR